MAKNMFYNYDVYADSKNLHYCNKEMADYCDDKQNAEYLYNIKGDFQGLKVKENSDFNVYFSFSSDEELELFNLLHTYPIALDILDFTYDPLVTIPAIMNNTINECVVNIDLAVYEKLQKGVYKLYLYYRENGIKKPLYTQFNLLSIE